jgi:hypothetical protein
MRKNNPFRWLRNVFAKAVSRYKTDNGDASDGCGCSRLALLFFTVYSSVVIILSFPANGIGIPPFPAVMLAVAVPAVVFVAGSHAAKLFSASGVYCDRRMMSPMKVFFSVFVIYAALVVFNRFDTPDTTWQWGQAVGERPLDDWHPLIHTFLVFLPTVVVKSGWFVAVAQSFAFAALVAWTYSALMKYGYNGRAVAIVLIISVFNPFSMAMACVLWKDTAFAYTGLALTVCLVHIVETDGDWLTVKKAVGVAALLFLASFVRHNGFFYTLPLALFLPFSVSAKNVSKTLVCIGLAAALSIVYVWGRNAAIARGTVENGNPHQRFSESVGLPMCMMAHCFVTHPEKSSPELERLFSGFGGRKFVEAKYVGSYNSFKFPLIESGGDPGKIIHEFGHDEFVRLFFETVKTYPSSAAESVLHVTSQAWSPVPSGQEVYGYGDVGWYQRALSILPGGSLIRAPGFHMLCLVFAFCVAFGRIGRKAFVFAAPLFCYQFGTMLFLSGDDYRFFYISVLTAGVCCLALLRRRAAPGLRECGR